MLQGLTTMLCIREETTLVVLLPSWKPPFGHLAQVPVRGCSYTLGTASSLNIANLQIYVNNKKTNKKAALVS